MTEAPAPQVVTAITVALATRLPMRSVERVHAEAGAGLVGDRYHGSKHRHVSVQSASELAESAERLGAPVPHDRGGSILRVLESGDIAVGDVWEELPASPA